MEKRPDTEQAPGPVGAQPAGEPPDLDDPDHLVDETIAGSFPASDPPQWWAGRRD